MQPDPRSLPDSAWAERFDRLDRAITSFLARYSVPAIRIAIGIVFIWFGALKLVTGVSPAEELATRTIETLTLGLVPPSVSLPVLGIWEVLIGLGLLTGRFLRATLLLLALQMAGTLTPLVLFPEDAFRGSFLVPTLEGQYIVKNLVIIAAAMVVGATVRGGRVEPEPEPPEPERTPADVATNEEPSERG